jgi:hypothetical protein
MHNLLIRFGISFFVTFAALLGCDEVDEKNRKQMINAAAADAVEEEKEQEEHNNKEEKTKGDY